jgi:hypothetical protein
LNYEYPIEMPLFARDERLISHLFWDRIFQKRDPKEKFILLLDSKGKIVAIYDETSRISEEHRKEIKKDILETINREEIKNYINYKNVISILKKSGILK